VRAILVPVKSFREAKLRLASVLGPTERAALVHALARRVFAAANGTPVFVACDDGEVADWAVANGAEVLFTPHLGLSGAVEAGVEHLGRRGFDLVVVAHADLPFAHDLDTFGTDGIVTLAPDFRIDGTNVIAVPPGRDFRFAYGRGSYARHRTEATRIGLPARTRYDRRLATDIDLPSDLRSVDALLDTIGASRLDAAHS
jgi:2-phospho-L-lactate/phosphoenolpyruvate guanylyltransferase